MLMKLFFINFVKEVIEIIGVYAIIHPQSTTFNGDRTV